MAVINEKQNITKRQKTPSFGHNNKSAGFNSVFMSQFSQKPVRSKKKKSAAIFMSSDKIKRTNKLLKRKLNIFPRKKLAEPGIEKMSGEKSSGFTIPLPSLPTIAVICGTIVIALAAFNWEDINIKFPENYVYQPDTGAEQQIMTYAAMGITDLFPAQDEGASSYIEEPQISNEHSNNDQNHLIAFEWQQYKVKRGDTVSGIAKVFDVSIGAIIASNEIRNARTLQEGAMLRVPNIDGIPYQVKNGDTLTKIAVSYNVPLEVILDVNDIKSDNIKAGETLFIPGARMNDMDLRLSLGELFIYPVPSRYITSHFGMRKDPISGALNFHTGIDLRANTGTPVVAALDGRVSVVTENWLYGKYVIVTHDNGYKTLYGHLNSFSVKQGERVARGKKIGEAGNTGYSTGPHLHFTIYDKNNKLINPLDLMR
ncbi:MAG: M23 family metallopeptidase [Treponema sp.]|nr:M23 family metallopeptidase [Treponema sp.]MCL2272632.1 M23 family metallopeptidase [Treponema sp.]